MKEFDLDKLRVEMNLRLITYALKTTLPVMFGYVPIGMAFGLMFTDLGYHWIHAFLMGVFVFAGSSQLLATGMLAMGESIWEIGFMTMLLNSRQGFFGIPLLHAFETTKWKKLYLVFTLSDEPFSVISTTQVPEEFDRHNAYVAMHLWMHFYWILGCTIGGLASTALPFSTDGMEFALTGMFVVLTIDQFKKVQQYMPFLVALGIGAFCIFTFERTHMLITSLSISMAYILMKGRATQWT